MEYNSIFLGIINVPIAEGEVGKDKRMRVGSFIYRGFQIISKSILFSYI